MNCVPHHGQASLDPGGRFGHVEERPDFKVSLGDMTEDGAEDGIKVFVYVLHQTLVAAGVPVLEQLSVIIPIKAKILFNASS